MIGSAVEGLEVSGLVCDRCAHRAEEHPEEPGEFFSTRSACKHPLGGKRGRCECRDLELSRFPLYAAPVFRALGFGWQ